MAEPETAGIEAEADDYENDSALGENDGAASSTASIGSSILKYREENGRTYHAYKDGKYNFPNDEVESERLDLQHHLFSLTFDGKLFTAPIPEEQQLHQVLDIGTGTGIWAIDFADAHPESQVLGIDLSPIQPRFIPPNLTFQVDDIEEPWTFSHKFDFIYSRMMVVSIANFPQLFAQAYEFLNPGGWIELADVCYPIQSDDGSLAEDSALREWSSLFMKAAEKIGRVANSAELYKSQLEAAGFTGITQTIYKWPQNRWPKDKKYKELGLWHQEATAPSVEGLSMALFTRVLGWSKEQVEVFLVGVRRDMKDMKIHAYKNVYVFHAQKPQ